MQVHEILKADILTFKSSNMERLQIKFRSLVMICFCLMIIIYNANGAQYMRKTLIHKSHVIQTLKNSHFNVTFMTGYIDSFLRTCTFESITASTFGGCMSECNRHAVACKAMAYLGTSECNLCFESSTINNHILETQDVFISKEMLKTHIGGYLRYVVTMGFKYL